MSGPTKFAWMVRPYQQLAKNDETTDLTPTSETKAEDAALLEKDIGCTAENTSTFEIIKKKASGLLIYWNLALFCSSLVILTWSILLSYGVVETRDRHREAWKIVNAPSPITDTLNLPFQIQEMKGSVVNVDNDVLRRSPSDEVDRAWNEIVEHEVSYVSSADLIKLGKDPAVSIKIPLSYDVGNDAYAVETDMLHKIHCLNRIRKDVYFDYYWRHVYPDGKTTELHQWHTNHCIYILLQALMCDASTDVIPLVWREVNHHPAQDFNLNRKCGDFAGVKRWVNEHSIPYDDVYEFEMPPGQKTAPMNLEFDRILQQPDPELPWILNHSLGFP